MKITKSQLKQIIKEELESILNERFVSSREKEDKEAKKKRFSKTVLGPDRMMIYIDSLIRKFNIAMDNNRKPRLTHPQIVELQNFAKKEEVQASPYYKEMIRKELDSIVGFASAKKWADDLKRKKQ